MQRREFLKIAGLTVVFSSAFMTIALKDKSIKELFKPVLIFDQTKCIGCKTCMAACQLEHSLEPETNLFNIFEQEFGKYPEVKLLFHQENICKECFHHPCITSCSYDAISVKKEGIVYIDKQKCNEECAESQKCAQACPYNAITFNKKQEPVKCDLCFERVTKRGDIPRCVAVCPSRALIFGNILKPEGELALLLKERPEVKRLLNKYLYAELNFKPVASDPYIFYKTKKPDADRIVNTVCLACNARCGLRVAVKGNRLIQVDGNPFHPYNRLGKEIPYNTSFEKSFHFSSTTCAKPQMDNDYLHNPYRITKPLKRIGPRGSGKFKPISWDELILEVSEGGHLFKDIGDNRIYPSIKDILSDDLIDPEAPELGAKRNQLVWFTGRSQSGRSHFIKRWLCSSVGSKNYISHTDICGIGFRMGNYALTDGKEVELKADFWNCKYMLIFGANLYSAIQPGVNTSGAILARRIASKDLKIVLVDPRAPKAIAHAYDWMPVKPTKDGDFALGILSVMLKNGWYDKDFLSLPSMKAAKNAKRNVYTNATHLVIVDEKSIDRGKILRVKDIKGLKGNPNIEVVIDPNNQKFVPADSIDKALLEWEGEVDGIKVKTAFSLMKESVFNYSLDFYSKESGISTDKINKTAREFWENAPYAAAFAYHGGGNYIGGTYASYSLSMLNALVGNINKEGGYLGKGKGVANWKNGLYDLQNFPSMNKPKGIKISREKAEYEKSTEFKKKGYPSKLPWFSFTKGGLSVSAISGIDQKYPYSIKILMTYFSNLIYSMPGGKRFIKTLQDHDKVPLYISIDTTINETNIYADYIVPDVTYLEGHYGFLTPHAPGCWFTAVRTPVFEPMTGKTKDGRAFCMETFLIDIARHLKLPGYGEKAIPGKDGKYYPLVKPEDYYLRGIANLAFNSKVKGATEEELEYIDKNYPIAKHKDILPEKEWKTVCNILTRGGVFKSNRNVFDENGNFIFGIPRVCIWNEKLGTSINSLTGEKFYGTIKHNPSTNYFGSLIEEIDKNFPFTIITYKSALHTQSRTIAYRQSLVYEPDFSLKINPSDANKLGIKDGDRVKINSNSNYEGVITTIKVTDLIRPGTVAYSHHFGHWQHGVSSLFIVDGEKVFMGNKNIINNDRIITDNKRSVGITPNLLTRLDEQLFNLPLVDPLGGIPDYSSTKINIEKI